MFDLFKKRKDEAELLFEEEEKENESMAEEPKKEVKKTSSIKVPEPTEVFTNLVSLEDYFACWFNEMLDEKISNGLTKYERVEHELELEKIPQDFLDYRCDAHYKSFKPTLANMLENSHFKPRECENIYTRDRLCLPWDNSNNGANYFEYSRLTDAYNLKKYELDDDKGFGEELTDIVFSENKSNELKRSEYHRTIKIKLSAFSPKYILTLSNYYYDCIYEDTTLCPRYENILKDNGWEVRYECNSTPEYIAKDNTNKNKSSKSSNAVIILKDRKQNETKAI